MTDQTNFRINLDGLEDMKKKVGNSLMARVGVLGNNASRSDGGDLNNAEIMLIQMFGSVSRKIPPRDPLVEPLQTHRRELIRKLGTGAMKAAFEAGDYKKMFSLLGIAAESIVQKAFETSGDGNWPANAQSTIDAKGSSMPLIDHGWMRKSVTSDVVTKSGVGSISGDSQ